MKNILFTSVVGPHGVDTPHSRYKNPMSLLSNQVTRGQQYYTVQMSSRTFAFDVFGANLDARVAILDFPMTEHLEAELRAGTWDRVGISGIMANFEKILLTYRIIRGVLPHVPIDIGGHITNEEEVLAEFRERILSVHPEETFATWPGTRNTAGVTFVLRDGLEYYGQLPGVGLKDPGKVFMPLVDSSFDKRAMGLPVPASARSTGMIIPDVGCPMKCNFCCTSQKFGGRFVPFLQSAEDILAVANGHADRGTDEMLIMSENFSLDTTRALQLLRLMEQQKRPYRFSVFSSASALSRLGVENLVKLGYTWVWIGLEESSGRAYTKMQGIDLDRLIGDLQAHGIEVLGSTIVGFEHQTAADVEREVEHALGLGCVYNQFMLYMPMPGTDLWRQMKAKGLMKKDFPWSDIHGQAAINWHHPHLSDSEIVSALDRAFERDFEELGPSLFRMARVQFNGYLKTADWDHELVQLRRAKVKAMLRNYVPMLSVMLRDLRGKGHKRTDEIAELRDSIARELGRGSLLRGRLSTAWMEPVLTVSLGLERRRYRRQVRLRRAESPRVLLTHYGKFDYRVPKILPRPETGIPTVAVERSREEMNKNPRPLAARPGPLFDSSVPLQ